MEILTEHTSPIKEFDWRYLANASIAVAREFFVQLHPNALIDFAKEVEDLTNDPSIAPVLLSEQFNKITEWLATLPYEKSDIRPTEGMMTISCYELFSCGFMFVNPSVCFIKYPHLRQSLTDLIEQSVSRLEHRRDYINLQ